MLGRTSVTNKDGRKSKIFGISGQSIQRAGLYSRVIALTFGFRCKKLESQDAGCIPLARPFPWGQLWKGLGCFFDRKMSKNRISCKLKWLMLGFVQRHPFRHSASFFGLPAALSSFSS
jgi:hypothetical protein